uniref:SSD domain-containing protein n=1 Tax=Elaeophora elaphi TaxID=1147741 RepID=A0A0R3RZD1_9BILA
MIFIHLPFDWLIGAKGQKEEDYKNVFSKLTIVAIKLLPGGNEEFCCDEKQVALLDAQMTLPRQFLARCPSCLTNFVQLWCDFTCAPNQANFVRVISSTDDLYLVTNKTEYVTEVAYYVRDSYADGLFQSCKDVKSKIPALFSFACLKRSQDGDLSDFKPAAGTLDDADLGTIDSLGSWIESQLELICAHYGQLCVKHPLAVFLFGMLIAILCSSGMLFVRFTTDPVELWSSWTSRARGEKYFFDNEFGPFYRMEQLIMYPRDQSFWPHENQSDLFELGFYGPALRKAFLQEVAELQEAVTGLVAVTEDGTRVTLTDVCFKPMTPDNQNCAIMTVLNYFQNNMTLLNRTNVDEWSGSQFDYLDHIMTCTQNPYQTITRLGIPCLSAFGTPIQPYVVLGEFNSSNQWDSARGIVITILLNNHITAAENKYAAAWEKVFALYLRNISHENYAISFMAERSIQDEIDRESQSDVFTILISYIFMFAYVAFALGQYQVTGNNLATLLVHSKVMLGVAGVMIVALSVTSSIGLYAFYGIPATTIVLEVQPFLVLAVGVDNIFIFVQAYQRAEEPLSEPLHLRISHISGEVIPSMLLSSLSECLCFFVGALSSMPAVKVFSLYAALAIFFNFFLQITCFLAIFILDVRREENGRPEVCCCRRITTVESVNNDGYMLYLFSNYYAPFLLSKYVRIIVIFLFAGWLSSSFAVMGNISLGFDQKMAVPEDSYVYSYFKSMDRFLSVGPPVYFVVRGDMEFSDPYEHNKICSGAGCAVDSLGAQIAHAARWSNRSYIAYPAMSWIDDYFDWLQPLGEPPCCRLFPNGTFCSATESSLSCNPCNVEFLNGRPRSDLFYDHLTHFFSNNPSTKCAKGGHAAYGSAVKLSRRGRILSSHFMTYHTVLKTSSDFINAMTSARRIAANITAMLNKDRDGRCPVEVFPYSVFYVFYEQYTTIVMDACIQLVLSLVAIFAITTILLGLDPWSAFIIDLTISCVLFNLIGLMYWWSIDFNAVSVVNLVMTVGISVEFCAHIVRSFALSVHRDRLMRARHSLATMGSSVLSGITLTKFGGILVLAFAHSQIFKVFYFRMFLGIVLIGAAHGLIFLPVLLSYIGPPMNKRKLIMKTRSESCCINDCSGAVTKACLTKHCDPSPLTDGDFLWLDSIAKSGFICPIGARVLEVENDKFRAIDDFGQEQWLPVDNPYRVMHATSVQGVEDMINLGDLHEAALLRNLFVRYNNKLIYTYVGSVLIAVNPNIPLPIYSIEQIRLYHNRRIGELPPHIFAIANSAYYNMKSNNQDQCIFISGESGSGKTESAKLVIQFLATISGQHSWIEQQVLEANPVLEAFGNAKTTRNDNSSRFGRNIDLYFTSNGAIEGARFEHYLLEKSRVVSQASDERNYHIFYCLLAGLTESEKRELSLSNARDFYYLNQGGTTRVEGRNDAADLIEIRSSMKVLMFKDSEIWFIFKILAAILHTGNIKHVVTTTDGVETVEIKDTVEIEKIANLLLVAKQSLVNALTTRTLLIGTERVVSYLSAEQTLDVRDMFVKAIYHRLFLHIVEKINGTMNGVRKEGSQNSTISILDIFGFENFVRNSFEQLCINYANEALHQLFINFIFKMEQSGEYISSAYDLEQIRWGPIDVLSDKEVLDLIALGPMSVISIMDEESILPKGTDQSMLRKLHIHHGKKEGLYFKPQSDLDRSFGIAHYAGTVFYHSKGFIDKNRDKFSSDLLELLHGSEFRLLRLLFDDVYDYDDMSVLRNKHPTVASHFRKSLEHLVASLEQKEPFFINCIVPNAIKRPLFMEREIVYKQMRYMNLLEMVKIRKFGYPIRYQFECFVERYRLLVDGIGPPHTIDCRLASRRICNTVLGPRADIRLGRTMIFLKEAQHLLLQQEQERMLTMRVTTIQKTVRGWIHRTEFKQMKAAAIIIEKYWRGYMQRQRYRQIQVGFTRLQAILRSRQIVLHYKLFRAIITQFQVSPAYHRKFYETITKLFVFEFKFSNYNTYFCPYQCNVSRECSYERSTINNDRSARANGDNLIAFQFEKFAAAYFQVQNNAHYTRKPLRTALLPHDSDLDRAAALAIWVVIQRFMGDISEPKRTSQSAEDFENRNGNSPHTDTPDERGIQNGNTIEYSSYQQYYNTFLNEDISSNQEKLQFIVGHGILRPDIRDEIYCQICKQLTKNPSGSSCARGWILLSLCLGCFAPTDRFLPYLQRFIRQTCPTGCFAEYIESKLKRTLANGTRNCPPNSIEIQVSKTKKPIPIHITFMDGTMIRVSADSGTISREICDELANSIALKDSFGFSLYIAYLDKVVSLGCGTDHIMDAISQCEQYLTEGAKETVNPSWRFFYRKEIFSPWHDPSNDLVSTNLIYHQIIRGIKYGEYRTTKEEELALLAAQQYYIYHEDSAMNIDKLENSLVMYLPEEDIQDADEKSHERWLHLVLHAFRKKFQRNHPAGERVKADVVAFAKQKWPLLFSRYFEALSCASPSLPDGQLLIAVNWQGIVVIDAQDDVILQLTYPQISRILFKANNKNGVEMLTIEMVDSEEHCFESPNAKEIKQLIEYFLDGLRNRSKYLLALQDNFSGEGNGNEEWSTGLNFKKGDLLFLNDEYCGASLCNNQFVKGENMRTGSQGMIPVNLVHVLPAICKPSVEALDMLSRSQELDCPINRQVSLFTRHLAINREHTLERFATDNFRPAPRPPQGLSESFYEHYVTYSLWSYNREPIKMPLLKKLQGKREPSQAAVKGYLAILKYMGDYPCRRISTITELTDEVFKGAFKYEIIRDEVYCQLIKQLTWNYNAVSVEHGWELMWLCTGLFPPSQALFNEVEMFFRTRQHPLALHCLTRLRRIQRSGRRKFPPHDVEVEAVRQRTVQIFHKAFFPDNSDEIIEVDSTTKAQDFCHRISARLGLKSVDGFALFVKVNSKVISIPDSEFFFDFLRQLFEWMHPKNGTIFNFSYQLFFMKKLWVNTVPGEDRIADLIFHYPQELPKYLRGYHAVTRQQAVELAAVVLRARTRDDKAAPLSQLTQIISDIVPRDMIKTYSGADWKKYITNAYVGRYENMPSNEAKIHFLKTIAEWPTFGSTFFEVKQSSDSAIPDKLLIAINKTGVHLHNLSTKQLIVHYPFTILSNWNSGNTYFHMTIGSLIKGGRGTRLLLETSLGYKMDDLLTSYIKLFLGAINRSSAGMIEAEAAEV